jgi:hypothetical protein
MLINSVFTLLCLLFRTSPVVLCLIALPLALARRLLCLAEGLAPPCSLEEGEAGEELELELELELECSGTDGGLGVAGVFV